MNQHNYMHHHPHEQHRPNQDHVIKLLLTEIKYDIKFDTWLREKVTNREMHNQNKEAEKVGYAYSDDKAEDWLVRQIETAMDTIRGELAWCVVPPERTDSDEILENPTEWYLHLHFSPNWRGSIRALKSASHKYVCEYTLAQWYRASMPNGSERYDYEADKWLERIRNEARSEVVVYHPWML